MVGFCSLILFWPQVGGLGLIEASFLPGWGSSPTVFGIWLLYLGVILAWAAGIHYIFRARRSSRPSFRGQRAAEGRHASNKTRDSRGSRRQLDENTSSFEEGYEPVADQVSRRRRPGELAATGGQRRITDSNSSIRRQSGDSARSSRDSRNADSARRRNTSDDTQRKRRQHQGSKQNNKQGGTAVQQRLNISKKMLIIIAIFLLLIVFIGFYGCDGIRNFGVIHQGVKVGDIDVSHMTEEEAAELLTTELSVVAMQAPVNLFASEGASIHGVTENTLQLGNGVRDLRPTEVDTKISSWSIGLGTLNAEVNGSQLAEEAYGVGRGGDFLLGRLAANAFGVTLAPRLNFSEDRLRYLEEMLTKSIGKPMVNASMSFDGGRFIVTEGQNGRVVDEEAFEKLLQQAFFSESREVVIPMIDRSMRVNRDAARLVAESTQQAISQPVTLSFSGDSWTLGPEQLGAAISSEVLQDEQGNWVLVPSVDSNRLKAIIPEVIGQIEDQIMPLDAEFVVVERGLQIVPSQNGTGIDYSRLAKDLNMALFEDTPDSEDAIDIQDRAISLQIGVLEADRTTSDVEEFDFSGLISEYTLYYPYVPYESIVNIHVAANHINSSIIAPYSIWSFIDSVGEFTPENGFVDSQIILEDEFVDGMGGGVCTVASTVFNAVWEAGYPIVERVNHSLRSERYPLGRDAAIAYPYADLKFENDTENYLLLTMTYTDDSITCMLWGIPPGYQVESIVGEFIEGADFPKKEVVDENLAPGQSYKEHDGLRASKVDVTRIVYDSEGNIKEKRVFYSSYGATPEVTRVGPDA